MPRADGALPHIGAIRISIDDSKFGPCSPSAWDGNGDVLAVPITNCRCGRDGDRRFGEVCCQLAWTFCASLMDCKAQIFSVTTFGNRGQCRRTKPCTNAIHGLNRAHRHCAIIVPPSLSAARRRLNVCLVQWAVASLVTVITMVLATLILA